MTVMLAIHDPAEASDPVQQAAACLRTGGLVAFATETVYGLGADASNPTAVARIYEAKGRPSFNPLISHFESTAAVAREVVFEGAAQALADAFWPGALTLVLPRRPGGRICDLACAGLATAAVRVPDHAIAEALFRAVDRPVAAPSANISGQISPTLAQHVLRDLDGRIDLILDAGATKVGLESSIVGFLGGDPVLLREGGISREDLISVAGLLRDADDVAETPDAPLSPGRLAAHYAPRKPLRLNATSVADDEVVLGFGPDAPSALQIENLSPGEDLREAAANLFAMLRQLDDSDGTRIAAMPIPEVGLGRAINDRLRRAAHD